MSETQTLTIALATVPTFLVVLVGILIHNSRLSDLRLAIDNRFSDMARVIQAGSRANEANFKLLLGKIDDIDSRLTRLEERFAR